MVHSYPSVMYAFATSKDGCPLVTIEDYLSDTTDSVGPEINDPSSPPMRVASSTSEDPSTSRSASPSSIASHDPRFYEIEPDSLSDDWSDDWSDQDSDSESDASPYENRPRFGTDGLYERNISSSSSSQSYTPCYEYNRNEIAYGGYDSSDEFDLPVPKDPPPPPPPHIAIGRDSHRRKTGQMTSPRKGSPLAAPLPRQLFPPSDIDLEIDNPSNLKLQMHVYRSEDFSRPIEIKLLPNDRWITIRAMIDETIVITPLARTNIRPEKLILPMRYYSDHALKLFASPEGVIVTENSSLEAPTPRTPSNYSGRLSPILPQKLPPPVDKPPHRCLAQLEFENPTDTPIELLVFDSSNSNDPIETKIIPPASSLPISRMSDQTIMLLPIVKEKKGEAWGVQLPMKKIKNQNVKLLVSPRSIEVVHMRPLRSYTPPAWIRA